MTNSKAITFLLIVLVLYSIVSDMDYQDQLSIQAERSYAAQMARR